MLDAGCWIEWFKKFKRFKRFKRINQLIELLEHFEPLKQETIINFPLWVIEGALPFNSLRFRFTCCFSFSTGADLIAAESPVYS